MVCFTFAFYCNYSSLLVSGNLTLRLEVAHLCTLMKAQVLIGECVTDTGALGHYFQLYYGAMVPLGPPERVSRCWWLHKSLAWMIN